MPWALFGKAKPIFLMVEYESAEQNFRQLNV